MKKWVRVFLFVGILVIGGAVTGYYLYNKPVKNFAESDADIKVKAEELFSDFQKNPDKAQREYVNENKTLEVEGIINEVQNNDDGTTTILLKTNDSEGSISCTLTKEQSGMTTKLRLKSKIKIKGQCTGYQDLISKEVILIGCGLTKS